MQPLSFWHRVAFIANICWLATCVMRYYAFIPTGDLQSTVVITGLIIANVVNFLVNIATCITWLRKRLSGKVPRWLLVANFIFVIAQLYMYVK